MRVHTRFRLPPRAFSFEKQYTTIVYQGVLIFSFIYSLRFLNISASSPPGDWIRTCVQSIAPNTNGKRAILYILIFVSLITSCAGIFKNVCSTNSRYTYTKNIGYRYEHSPKSIKTWLDRWSGVIVNRLCNIFFTFYLFFAFVLNIN